MQLMPLDLVRGEVNLPLLPDIYHRFNDKLADPSARAQDFSDIISTDPALTMRLLRIVNSAYYRFEAEIDDVSHAVTIIGLGELRDLVLAVCVVEFFEDLPNQVISMDSFWRHSVLTALIARELQQLPAMRTRHSLFTAGMLHDIGAPVFYNRMPEVAASVVDRSQREQLPRYLIEREILGFDHAAIGSALAAHWRLPHFLSVVIGQHHAPVKVEEFGLESCLLAVADQLSHAPDTEIPEPVDEILAELPRVLTVAELLTCRERAEEQLQSVLSAIRPR